MKVKDLLKRMAYWSNVDKIEVVEQLHVIDTLEWPDCAPYKLGNKYENATLHGFAVVDNATVKIFIEQKKTEE